MEIGIRLSINSSTDLKRKPASSTRQRGSLPLDPTFAEVWERYRTLKAAKWGSALSKASG